MWQPTTTLAQLKTRAEILAKIREFFAIRQVMEVETPLLSQATVPTPYIHSLTTECFLPGQSQSQKFYLQTSPEFAMKRLLAASSGPIYQICKAFRADHRGRFHNPEFTILEWYRPGFTHRDLMIEVDALLRRTLTCEVAKCESYGELFQKHCDLNPYAADIKILSDCAKKHRINFDEDALKDKTDWLQFLMMHLIEPRLGQNRQPTFVIDFPAEQAALAKIDPGPPAVAERFEVYWKGVELANGFHELCDAQEQRRRFEEENASRRAQGLPEIPIDENFLAALSHGLPACAGVALGVDRLVMAALGATDVSEVMAFPIERA